MVDREKFGGKEEYMFRIVMSAAYEYLDLGKAEIANLQRPAGTLDGNCSSNHVHFIALNVTLKF